MIEVLSAFLLGGATGFVAKDKLFDNKGQQTDKQNELNDLYAENERNRELERQVEDLLAELNTVRKRAQAHDEDNDDLEYELDKA